MASQSHGLIWDATGTSPALLSPWELWRDAVGTLSPGRTLSPGTCRPPSACCPPATCCPLRHALSLRIPALSGTRCPQNTSCPSGHIQLPPHLETRAVPSVTSCPSSRAAPYGTRCPQMRRPRGFLLSLGVPSVPQRVPPQAHVPPDACCPLRARAVPRWLSPVPHPFEPAAGACPGPCAQDTALWGRGGCGVPPAARAAGSQRSP